MRKVMAFAWSVILFAAAAAAQSQQPQVSYSDDFQAYRTPSNPPGWVDNPIGVPRHQADGLYKVWPDPTNPSNNVYGTKQSSGRPDGNTPRIGTFSTYLTKTFAGKGRFEYRGRMLRTTSDARIGLVFFSAYTDVDAYYLIGLWSRPSGDVSMQLFGFGAGTVTGTTDSGFVPAPNTWYRFLIQVDDVANSTNIRARFWPDGTTEPNTFSINAADQAAGRLTGGHIGIWAAVRGDAFIDDISAQSPVDHTPPTIAFFESGNPLPDGSKFNRNATPEIRVADDLSSFTYTATLDGAPFISLTAVTTEGWHTLAVHAVDAPGNASDAQVKFLVDKTAPVVTILEGQTPFPPNFYFNRDVVANVKVVDISNTTVTGSLDGQPYTPGTPISPEGNHSISFTAVDEVGWSTTAGPIPFTIDKTPPKLTFTSNHDGDIVAVAHAVVSGGSDDAVTVTVNGKAAVVDPAAKTFTSADLPLLEGDNTITATGTDRAGNIGSATLKLVADTRAPDVAITAPPADVCLDATSLQVTGTVAEPHLDSIKVTVGSAAPVIATVDASGTSWSTSVPVDEAKLRITVVAADKLGHTTSISRTVTIDRTAPSITVRENGSLFTVAVLNHAPALFIGATDADPAVIVTSALDGAPYVSGTPITTEGLHHLAVSATDCAGHKSAASIDFTVDLTPPTIRNLNPANGATVGTLPTSISATTDPDAVTAAISGTSLTATPAADGTFTISSVPFVEGLNHFTLVVTDRAGNSSSLDYSVTVKTTGPSVEIRESGLPIPDGTLFNRSVTPLIRSNDPAATITATLNDAPFASGSTITNDGSYKISATATDTLGHTGSAVATFSIDKTPPLVTITAPQAGTVQSDHVDVRGSAGDSISAAVNGQPVTLAADGSFALDGVLLDAGLNTIVATGRDRAGNVGRAQVQVTRDDIGSGILITYPPDHSLTNRPTTDVVGRVLSPGRASTVQIGSTSAPVDPIGAFRVSGYALVEGLNTITASVTATTGVQASASTHVTADFTPPALTILESGQPLSDGARFATQAVVSIQASDSGGDPVTTSLTVDGTVATTLPFTITAAGGHTLVAIATDLAGNQSRSERTLFIGTSTGTAGCNLDSFDPADGAVILANKTTLVGRSGGAIGVKVNGIPATVADGAFLATVELPAEGPNPVTIACTDANGNATGTPVTITLQRVTGDPSISIAAPDEGFVSAQETIAVSGTVGAGVVSADVNGVAAPISGSTFSAPSVRLAPGLNVLVAHGKNAAGRTATASRRGVYLKDGPSISITSPGGNAQTGFPQINISGTYTNLDPATITVSAQPNVQVTRASDTNGSYTANVPLVSGDQTITVSGRDRLNRQATASVVVTLYAGTPGIVITQPVDHATFGAASDSVVVSGSFVAAAGAGVDVNGVTATITGTTYTASVKFSTLAGGITPIVARVTEPSGVSASASIVVTQMADAPTVKETFPAANAVEVDAGALILVLFSQPMDGAITTNGAFRLEDANGTPVSGTAYLDKDVLTFAPAALLTPGAHATIRVTIAAKNLAGTPLASEFTSGFTVGTSAPATAPTVAPIATAICGQSITITGTATPGARVQLQSGTLTLDATADSSGNFKFTDPISGQSGFVLLQVRAVGSDGSLSPAAQLNVHVDCSGPQVLNAAYDRVGNKLTIQFSEAVAASTVTVGSGNTILLTLDDGRIIGGTPSVTGSTVTITPAEDLTAKSFALTISTAVTDLVGNPLGSPFSQSFPVSQQPTAGNGSGFISGEVYDATTGRPLANAAITIDVPSPGPVTTSTDARGRYLARVPEGAHTIKASLTGYTSVWRQIIVPAGAGVVPIDMRLTRRGDPKTSDGSAITLTHGGDTTVTRSAVLSVPAAALTSGRTIALTAIGAQALTGLLPLGWSPAASAEVVVDGADAAAAVPGSQLTFTVPAADITAATQNLTAVRYDSVRDEWHVLIAVVNVGSGGTAVVPISGSGAFALVYPDKGAGLTAPALPVTGDVLRGVPAAAADAPALVKHDFVLNPSIVLPTRRTVAMLRIEGSGVSFPSGTAVQAYIDEDLKLSDGSQLLDPPFATDLLLYRTLDGTLGVADFHLAPTVKAAQVVLEIGFDHIHVFPYPGRLDRGTLIGSEGGRVPSDDKVTVNIPAGGVPEPLRASAISLTSSDLASIGAVAGFRVVGGFQLTLQRVTQPPPQDLDGDGQPDPIPPVELFVPANVTFSVDASQLPSPGAQVILGEVLDSTPYGRMVRLAVPMTPADPSLAGQTAVRFMTKAIDRSILPVDGVPHEGRYLVLAAESPIAFATGTVHLLSATGRLTSNARVLAPPLGVAELSRVSGIYNIPVPAKPAAPFTLVPRDPSTGDGAPYTNPASPDPDAVIRVDLAIVPQPPVISSVVVFAGDPAAQATLTTGSVTNNVTLTTNIRASFTPSIDPASVNDSSIVVTDAITGLAVNGKAAADGTLAVVWTLAAGERFKPSRRYNVIVSGTIRGTNGATLPSSRIYSFSTIAQLLNTDVHRERIRITIPDANGTSQIIGDPGALPAGWQAVAVRRNVDFITRYQATAASDGSFSFAIGNGPDATDRVTIGDRIDLQVVNTTGNVAAIFALTPFVTADGHGFVAPVGEEIRFSTPEGHTLDVPAGAFDVPTVITMTPATHDSFTDIYQLDVENEYVGSVNINFDGTAKKPLGFEAPIPAGFDTTGKLFILAQKGMSMQGPRLAMVDLIQPGNGKFALDHSSPNVRAMLLSHKPGPAQTLTGSRFTKYLTMLIRGGLYTYLDIRQPVGGSVGFAVMEGLQAGYDLTWSIFWSYYVPHIAVYEHGGAVLPILTGTPFTVTGTDPGTGLQAFSRAYDPIPVGDPGTVVPIPPAQQNDGGPYPVFAGPSRVEIADLDVEQVDIHSVRNFNIRLDGGSVTVSPGIPALDANTNVELLNISNGTFTSGTAGSTLTLSAKLGNRIVLLIEEDDVDPTAPISVAFSEPIAVGGSTDPGDIDTFLHGLLKVEYAPEPPAGSMPAFSDVTGEVRFTTDSGNRRVNVELPGPMQSEAVYRVTLKPDIADVASDPLKLGQGTVVSGGSLTPVGGGNAFHLSFHVRKPAGPINSFSAASQGFVTGMDLAGNVLFLAAQNGGLLSFDISNPAGAPVPLGVVPGPPLSGIGHLAVTVDRHNRVFATAQAPASNLLVIYRVEDFVAGGTPPSKGQTLISWKLGLSQMLGLPSNTMLSDRPESIPLRVKVLMQDDEQNFDNRQAFVAGTGAAQTGDYPDRDLRVYTASFANTSQYRTQRVTVQNLSLDMRWSADTGSGSAVIQNIIARSTDKMRVLRNQRTYAVVAHVGYGIGIYDTNAIESNRFAGLPVNSPDHQKEQLILTAGKIARDCYNPTPDYGIIENYLNTDAELRGDESGAIYSYAPDPYRGLLDLKLSLPTPTDPGTRDDTCEQRPNPNTGGLLFRSTPAGNEVPRIQALHDAFVAAVGREPFNHFMQLQPFHWSISAADNSRGLRGTVPDSNADRDYMLIAGADYGLIVVDVGGRPAAVSPWPLTDANVADVIWIPGGANGVRVYQDAHVATVIDRYGRVVVVDLSRIDERWEENGNATSGLFPTAAKALRGAPADAYSIGADDPRILWKSDPFIAVGTLAPVFDPYTGMLFVNGANLQVKVLSAIDPRVQVKVNLDDPAGPSDVSGIVPLGIAPPKDIQDRIDALPACDGSTLRCKENASLGAFRLEVALPGNMADSLTASSNELWLALESERVSGAITEQTPDGFPRSHLRRSRRDGSPELSSRAATNFKLTRIVPDALRMQLRSQRGYNKFISPWIIAIADPRASSQYNWRGASTQQKADAGCEGCDRPKHLEGKTESDGVYELWTNGRFIAVRPELLGSNTIFNGTPYGYLGNGKRLLGRFSTIMADTVRPTEVLVAAQNAPVADGALQQTTFLHSGELETSNADLDAGGRAGFNVVVDRTYRSRTIGGSVFGQGWDSSMLRRLRALPNGDVEYRDGAEVWRFRANLAEGGYDSPKGLFLKLARTQRGWQMTDQQWRVTEFDDLGRLISEADEFFDPQTRDSGNIIRYVYDETGRLAEVIDPVQRASTISYWQESEAGATGAYPGLVKEISDWRDRKLDYSYDAAAGTLLKVQLPDVANTSSARPAVQYTYSAAAGSYNDVLELRGNLESITDPQEVATGGAARVKFTYDPSTGITRDHVLTQQWGTGETASFTYNSPASATTKDILGQSRTYTMTAQPKNAFDDRAHVTKLVESGVTVASASFGQLPGTIQAQIPSTNSADRTSDFTYDGEGQITASTVEGVRSVAYTYNSVQPQAPGFVPASMAVTPLAGPTDPITQAITYQSGGPNRSTFISSISANGQRIDAPEPSRANRNIASNNDSISATSAYDANGQMSDADSSGGTDPSSGGAAANVQYAGATAPKHQRALVSSISEGGLKTSITYPSPTQSIQTDARGIVTTTDYDAWQRPIHVNISGPQVTVDDRFQYDATGHLMVHTRKQGGVDVTQSYTYDVMGRPTSFSIDNTASGGTLTRTVSYNLLARAITTNHPGGAVTTTTLDSLGRIANRVTTTGGSPINDYFAYDIEGNTVFETDLLTASANAYDAHGRPIGSWASDESKTTTTFDAWGHPTNVKESDGAGTSIGESTLGYTPAGRLQSIATKVDASQMRTMNLTWDGGGRTTGIASEGRAAHERYDSAGRLLVSDAGGGDASNVTNSFDRTDASGYSGTLVQTATKKEKTSSAYAMATEYNTLGQSISDTIGSLEWKQTYDEAGNMTSSKPPNRPAYGFDRDSQGLVKRLTLPGGAFSSYSYSPTGALASYADPANEVTNTTNDLIGRPVSRSYKDGTQEKIEWEGRRVKTITDRQGRVQAFAYNDKGQISQIAAADGTVLDKIEYDGAGRVTRWTTPDAIVEYSDFDLDGHPRHTSQSRLLNGALIDKYTQDHSWNVHGERSSWTMPTYTGFNSQHAWTSSVTLDYDVAGNITTMQRALNGGAAAMLLQADYRNSERPNQRTLTTPAGGAMTRTYGYDSSNGLINRMAVDVNGKTIAGSEITYDGTQKVKARMLGVSGGARENEWIYDERSRLKAASLGVDPGATPADDNVNVGDFRTALSRLQLTPVDPPSLSFQEAASGGHKIAVVQRGTIVETFTFNAGERREDGRFIYDYDKKGRLATATLKVPPGNAVNPRRVNYSYDGSDRLIGRRAEYAPVPAGTTPAPSDWKLEDRAEILKAEGLPADSTFVWDPIDDQLVAIFKAGSSQNPSIDDNGGLVRQMLHGGLRYDDPLEVTAPDSTAASGVTRLYPVYDEAGAKQLQVILNDKGQIVSRGVAAGPFGEDQAVLLGPAVDKIEIKASRDGGGHITSIDITVRSTEQIAAGSVPSGFRLASVTPSGDVVNLSGNTPGLADEATAKWSLTEADWNSLIASGGALSIAATNSLRGDAWSASRGFLAAPKWAVQTLPVFTSDALPVEARESLAGLSQWLASIPAGQSAAKVIYQVPTLYALALPVVFDGSATFPAGDPQVLIVSSSFHAHPFQDPTTGKNYVRARWLDTQTGTWLTPDPKGYKESSNLYAYCGNDPVNCFDPTGANGWDDAWAFTKGAAKTLATGVVVTVGVTALVVITGVSAPVVIAAGVVVAAGGAAYNGYQRYKAGQTTSIAKAGLMGLGDVTGVNMGIEVATGNEVGTGRKLSETERWERAGEVTGIVATIVAGPKIVKATVPRATAVRNAVRAKIAARPPTPVPAPTRAIVKYDPEFAARQMRGRLIGLYDEDIASQILKNPNPTVGRPGGGAWTLPADEVFRLNNAADIALKSGLPERVANAAAAGEPIYGTVLPEGVPSTLPTGATPGTNPNFTGRGFTGVRGPNWWMLHPEMTERIVPHMPMPPGSLIVKFIPGKGWVVVKAF